VVRPRDEKGPRNSGGELLEQRSAADRVTLSVLARDQRVKQEFDLKQRSFDWPQRESRGGHEGIWDLGGREEGE